MDETVSFLKALADNTRLELIKLLLSHDYCVGALAKKLGFSESAISQHLRILRSTGLVKGDKRGYYTHYYVDRQMLLKISDELSGMARIPADPRKCHEGSYEGCCRCKTDG